MTEGPIAMIEDAVNAYWYTTGTSEFTVIVHPDTYADLCAELGPPANPAGGLELRWRGGTCVVAVDARTPPGQVEVLLQEEP